MSTPTHCHRCSTPFSGTVPMEKGKPVCPTCREPLPTTEERATNGELAPGTMLGQYQILEVVGRGGMGLVYTAIQMSLHRKVAVKTLAHDRANAESFRRRFERESLALATMDHPNIVRVIDRGTHEDIPYFVMDFVDGMDLRAYMQGRRLSLDEVVRITAAVCDGLDYAHRRQVIHRDIKPENILIDKFGQVKITDFGLSRMLYGNDPHATRLTMTDMVMGTIDYIAPEQKDGLHQVDHRADIFALGVVLYEMLTATAPRGKFDPPSVIAHTPPALDAVVFKALSADPRHRYQSAGALRQALEEAARIGVRGFAAMPAGAGPAAAPPRPLLPSDLTDVSERVGLRLRTVSSRVPPKEIRAFLWRMYGAVLLLAIFGRNNHEAIPIVAGLGLIAVAVLSTIGTRLFQPGPGPHPRYALRQEGYQDWKHLLWLAYAGMVIWVVFRHRGPAALPLVAGAGALLTSALAICTRPLFRYAIPESVGSAVLPGQALEARLWAHAPEADRPPGAVGRQPGTRRLCRSRSDRWIAGVAGGMAAHLEISPVWTRLAWAVLALMTSGLAIVPYLVFALALPREDEFAPSSPLVVEPDEEPPQTAAPGLTAAPLPGPAAAAPAYAAAPPEVAAAPAIRPRRTRWASFALFWGILCLVVHLLLVPASIFMVRIESQTAHLPATEVVPDLLPSIEMTPHAAPSAPLEIMPPAPEPQAPPHTGEAPPPPDWEQIQPLLPSHPVPHGKGNFAVPVPGPQARISPKHAAVAVPVAIALMALLCGNVARERIRRSNGRLTGWRSASFARSVGIFCLFLWATVITLFRS